MDDAARRKQDIELKKKRLAEMRKTRVEGAAAAVSAPPPAPEPTPVAVAPPHVNEAAETEDLVSSLLASVSLAPTKPEPAATCVVPTKSREEMLREKIASFTTVKSFNTVSILPTTMVKYDKTCQTEEEDQFFLSNPNDVLNETALESDEEEEEETEAIDTLHRTPSKSIKSPSPRKGLFSPKVQQSQIYGKLAADLEMEAKFVTQAQVKLSDEERAKITANKVFQSFLQTTSLYVERALAVTQEHDVIRDFSVDEQGTSGDLAAHAAFLLPAVPLPGHAAVVSSVYEEDGLAGRPVMDLRWSPLVPELFLAAYGARTAPVVANGNLHKTASFRSGAAPTSSTTSAPTEEEAPGVVCVWSRDLHRRPEYRFTASSPVLAAVFHSHEQHLVLGGCYSGQILLWDMKLNKALPVQRSSMSGKGHKHPVYAMAMTTSAVAAELISVSTDGLLCHWDVTRLTEPLSVVQLHVPTLSSNPLSLMSGLLSPVREGSSFASGSQGGQGANPLNISAMAFGQSAGNSGGASGDHGVGSTDIIFGSGSGQLVRTPLPYKDNNPGSAKVDAHYGLITSIEPHPSRSNKYKHLVLSSSLDWTVKLWDLKNFSQPLIEFFTPSYDYVCDVQWSPVHPAVFVTVTSGGRISLWNLAKSSTEPVDAINVVNDTEDTPNNTTATAGTTSSAHAPHAALRALNKVVWARDGQSVLCGDSQGTLHLLKLHAPAVTPTPADEGRFEMAIVSHQVDSHHAVGESKVGHSSDVTPTKVHPGRMVENRSVESEMDLLLE